MVNSSVAGEPRPAGSESPPGKPAVVFLGSTYAGHATRFANLQANVESDDRIRPTFRRITGWNPAGRIERLPGLQRGLKGRLRATFEARHFATFPRPDAIWTSGGEELTPYALAQRGRFRRPALYDLDATDRQLEQMSWDYFGRAPKTGLRSLQARLQDGLVRSAVTVFLPWSNWAADGLIKEGVDPDRIRVIPPGVDLARWSVPRRDTDSRPLRVLFVGGDFRRKGGDLLVQAAAARADELEVLLVTRDEVGPLPGNTRVLRAESNSSSLTNAFAWADIFVMPTRAECFGIATVEAMASGLPVIVGDVGGARDIVADTKTGWLIEPTVPALENALDQAIQCRSHLRTVGGHGRKRAERFFDGRRNDAAIVDLILETLAARQLPGLRPLNQVSTGAVKDAASS